MQAARGASLNHSDQQGSDPATRFSRRHVALFTAIAAFAYVADVVSKVVAVDTLTGRPPVEIVGEYFTLNLARNPGAAFSTGTGHTEILTGIAVVAAALVIWLARGLRSTGWAVGLGFLLGGVLGNLTDRMLRSPGPFRGHVVDFFMFPNFPVFNVADICINLAAATIIIQALRGVRLDGRTHKEADASKGSTLS